MAPQHFLVVAFPGQGHINPARALAERLARATPDGRVTLSAAVSAHRLMFPSLASPDQEVHDGAVSYVPYSDGYDRGFRLFAGDGDDARRYCEAFSRVGSETLSAVMDRLAARGRPVTCVVYAMLMWWAAEVARDRGVPRLLYWTQPATMLAVYYHYFHGYERIVTEHATEPGFTVAMPGLPPMAIRDLPSFFTNFSDERMVAAFGDVRKTFEQLDLDVNRSTGGRKPMVLVNTIEELELGALASVPELDLFPIGPAVISLFADGTTRSSPDAVVGDLFVHDGKAYMEWLDTKPARSVVYVSFGSMSSASKRQKEEMKRGLAASGRPYLWVVRKDNRDNDEDRDNERGMVVEWCDQVRVLSHPAVGCFVTHCGWNSTLESLACGTPVVAVPQWSDQDTNTRLVVQWDIGVRATIDADRFLDAEELTRCVELVMGDTKDGAAIRRSSTAWKAKVQVAIADGGSSEHNFKTFQDQFANHV
ncbi:cyanidin 3-O-rutinoside 5-O-glucosyltransferase-like [Lolium rigidum]|uniref:cyanidin 3-O-rutinoside 5-O-glucosyltransferase-like n=1 Tax=Lolium rigidum TaxID=89674 RepID=UPI001F5DF5B5|nr:cyanidin 3-O-rutinoside 5-O-glucosyltransferase-like [Lolium rigidum]